jgi:hypothetical protein
MSPDLKTAPPYIGLKRDYIEKLPQAAPYEGTRSVPPTAITYKCQLKPVMRRDHRLTAAEGAYADADTCLFPLGDNTDAREAAELILPHFQT